MKTKNTLSVTVVIPCADDVRIKSCIESIDENVEILVVLNGATKKVVNIVKKFGVRKVVLRERNLAKALNVGIKKAKNSKVILIDSDCTFQKGAIRKAFVGLDKNLIVKGRVIFRSNSFFSKIIAKTRDYSYYDSPKPYNPFLCIRKGIVGKIGGYYFDERIFWTEDADLNQRIKKAGIKVEYVYSAIAYHPPLTLSYDLRSAFRYGIGKRIRVEKGTASGIGTHFEKIPDVVVKKGILVGIYYFFWNLAYLLGYAYQVLKDPYKTRKN
ncbi:MAG: glycosyltransferase [Candidatus Heimdallarchaeaceae archaeon]